MGSLAELKNHFCINPWTYVEIFGGGSVHVCCPAWSGNKPIGNIFENTPEEIWNSYQAVKFREGILDGSFDQCELQKCPLIIGNQLPTRAEVRRQDWFGAEMAQAMDQHQTILATGPRDVKIGYDTSCNLWCPSCRSELILAKKPEQDRLRKVRDEFIVPFLKDTVILTLSADGDPFGSNHYRDVMRVTYEHLPNLKLGLHTNAVLFDERAWEECHLEGRLNKVQISIDAAKAETYAYTRRGGDFGRLMRNLDFISKQRQAGAFHRLDLAFVVQTRNFLEIAEFVRLGQRLGADSIEFSLIDHWTRGMDSAEYREQKIWDPSHTRHVEFLKTLEDPILREPIVKMSALDMLLDNRQPDTIRVGD